jgi:hypothetical protein
MFFFAALPRPIARTLAGLQPNIRRRVKKAERIAMSSPDDP